MSIREEIERMEAETLSPYATLSIHSRGRDVPGGAVRYPTGFSERP